MRNRTVRVAKTKELISCAVTAQLICAFVFANYWFSDAAALIENLHCSILEHRNALMNVTLVDVYRFSVRKRLVYIIIILQGYKCVPL